MRTPGRAVIEIIKGLIMLLGIKKREDTNKIILKI